MNWYQGALPGLTGISRQQTADRVEEIEKEVPIDIETCDWANINPVRWERLEGRIVTVAASESRTESGLMLRPGQRIRVVPHPTESWTHRDTFKDKEMVVTCTWQGGRDNWGFRDHDGNLKVQPLGKLLCWLEVAEVPAHGELKGPGKVAFGPCVYPHQLKDSTGSLRVKLVEIGDE